MIVTDWSRYPNFSPSEFVCPCCGRCGMQVEFMDELQALRNAIETPIRINSGFRCPEYNDAIGGAVESTHLYGLGADCARPDYNTRQLVALLVNRFDGVGIRFHGDADRQFFHVSKTHPFLGGALWTYDSV